MTANKVQQEVYDVWVSIKDKDFPNAQRIDVAREINRTERTTAADARKHLTLWLTLTDESLHFLLLMYRFAVERVDEVPEATVMSTVAFRSLLARMCALTMAIRRLVVAGLEDAARSVMRSWLETQDLLIVVLADEEFAERYSSAVHAADYDANEFWKAEIGYGRLNKRIIQVLGRAEMTSEQKEDFLENRKVIKEKLSESVHSSLPSAMFSEVTPSLSKPNFYNRSLLGHVSIHAPNLLSIIVEETHKFGGIFYTLLTRSESIALFSNKEVIVNCSSLHAAFLTLEEMVERYSEMLPPAPDSSGTEED